MCSQCDIGWSARLFQVENIRNNVCLHRLFASRKKVESDIEYKNIITIILFRNFERLLLLSSAHKHVLISFDFSLILKI